MTRFSLSDGMELSGVSIDEVWGAYAVLGGGADPAQLTFEIRGDAPVDDREHDLIAQALNECFLEHGVTTFPVGYASAVGEQAKP